MIAVCQIPLPATKKTPAARKPAVKAPTPIATASAVTKAMLAKVGRAYKKADMPNVSEQKKLYDSCFLALYVFCGEQLLASYLRKSKIDSPDMLGRSWLCRSRHCVGAGCYVPDSDFCRWRNMLYPRMPQSPKNGVRQSAYIQSRLSGLILLIEDPSVKEALWWTDFGTKSQKL
jgi:hypothetical protein